MKSTFIVALVAVLGLSLGLVLEPQGASAQTEHTWSGLFYWGGGTELGEAERCDTLADEWAADVEASLAMGITASSGGDAEDGFVTIQDGETWYMAFTEGTECNADPPNSVGYQNTSNSTIWTITF